VIQSTNENFNASVWALAPKSSVSGKTVLDISINLTVCQYNDGYKRIMQIMQVLGLLVDPTCYNFCEESDARRIDFGAQYLGAGKGNQKINCQEKNLITSILEEGALGSWHHRLKVNLKILIL